MSNLDKLLFGAVCLLFPFLTNAGEALLFNDPGLTAYKDDEAIVGFYSTESGRFSCMFMFFTKRSPSSHTDEDGFEDVKIFTYVPGDGSLAFEDRDKTFDIDGDLYRRGDEWIIRTSRAQAGCENSAGTFIFDRADFRATSYSVALKIPAIGIRLIRAKSYFYDYNNGKYVSRKSYLTRWNGVILLRRRREFSYVRFVDTRANARTVGRVTTGWIHSSDLVDPFPSLLR